MTTDQLPVMILVNRYLMI